MEKHTSGQKDKSREEIVYETDHVLKMWTPCPFHVTERYNYFPKGPLFRLLNRVLRSVIYLIFPLIHKVFFGLRVTGKKNLRKIEGMGAVTVCNHVHILDCVMVACNAAQRSICFPTLASNFRIPVIRHLIRWLGAAPIPESKKCFMKLSESLEEHVKQGGLVHFYPETVMHPYYIGLRGFKRGAFLLAAGANAPVLPYVVTYRRPKGVYRYFKKKPCLTLHILEPVWPDLSLPKREGAAQLRDRVFEKMRECVNPPRSPESQDNRNPQRQ